MTKTIHVVPLLSVAMKSFDKFQKFEKFQELFELNNPNPEKEKFLTHNPGRAPGTSRHLIKQVFKSTPTS